MPDIIEQYEASLAILRREHTQDQWDRLQTHIAAPFEIEIDKLAAQKDDLNCNIENLEYSLGQAHTKILILEPIVLQFKDLISTVNNYAPQTS